MNIESLPKWDNYYIETNTEFQSDETERPPLTGKNRYVPNGLYDEKWGDVYDAYGKADLTPYYIEALTSDDDNDVNFGVYGLYSATTHQGSVYKSSKMAVPYLADLLKFNNNASELACIFLARIALGEKHFINTPFFYKTKYYADVKKYKNEILDYYNKSNSLEAMRLLCFIPNSLKKILNFSYDECLKLENKNNAYIRQASTLLVQGFIAAEHNYKISNKGYYKDYPNIINNIKKLKVNKHIEEVYNIMNSSESLLVRGCAAICLAYTGVFNKDISDLLLYIAENNCEGVDWVWDDNFSNIVKHAWVYSSDIETLLNTEGIKAKSDVFIAGSANNNKKSYDDILTEAALRVFPYKNKKEELINPELNYIQKRVLKKIVDNAPHLLGSYELEAINMPLNIEAAKRLIDDDYIKNKILCKIIDSKPLWCIIEEALIKKDETTITDIIINNNIDGVKLLFEIYAPIKNIVNGEVVVNTLNIYSSFDDKKILDKNNTILLSSIADCLSKNIKNYKKEIFKYLDETLIKVNDFKDDYDYKEKLAGEYVGVFLLTLGRLKLLDKKYYKLVRPYHKYIKYSVFPSRLFFELLSYTSSEHQELIKKQFNIKKIAF